MKGAYAYTNCFFLVLVIQNPGSSIIKSLKNTDGIVLTGSFQSLRSKRGNAQSGDLIAFAAQDFEHEILEGKPLAGFRDGLARCE